MIDQGSEDGEGAELRKLCVLLSCTTVAAGSWLPGGKGKGKGKGDKGGKGKGPGKQSDKDIAK